MSKLIWPVIWLASVLCLLAGLADLAHAQAYVPPSGAIWTGAVLPTPTITNGTATGTAIVNGTVSLGVNPTLPTCPVSNCPISTAPNGGGGPVLSAQWIYGQTQLGSAQAEWESSVNLYIGTGKGNGQKVAQYIGAMQGPGAGTGWALNTDIVRGACPGGTYSLYGQPGSGIPYGNPGCAVAHNSIGSEGTIGYELDISDYDADQTASGAFIVGEYINAGPGSYTMGAGISFGATSGTSAATSGFHHGIEWAPYSVEDYTLYDVSNSSYSLETGGTHAQAVIADSSTGARAILLSGNKTIDSVLDTSSSPTFMHTTGTHSGGSFADSGNSPFSLQISGTHNTSVINDSSTSPTAFNLAGTYSLALLYAANSPSTNVIDMRDGQEICFVGGSMCLQHQNGKLYYMQGSTPLMSVADSTGNAVFKGTVTQSGSP